MASYYRLRTGRPRLRKGHPMAQGLVGAWAFPGGYGQDLVGSNHATTVTGSVVYDGALGLGTLGSTGSGLSCTATSDIKLQPPLTYIWSGYNLATISGSSYNLIFGVTYNWPATNPYWAYSFQSDSAPGHIVCNGNDLGAEYNSNGFSRVVNGPSWLAGYLTTAGSNNLYFYSGDPTASSPATGSLDHTTINYTATSSLCIGSNTPNCYHDYALIYNRAITDLPELSWLYNRGQDLFARPHGHIGWVAALRGADYGNSNGVTGNTGSYQTSFGFGINQHYARSVVMSNGVYSGLALTNATMFKGTAGHTNFIPQSISYYETGSSLATKVIHGLVAATGSYSGVNSGVTLSWISAASSNFSASTGSYLESSGALSLGNVYFVAASSKIVVAAGLAYDTIQSTYKYAVASTLFRVIGRPALAALYSPQAWIVSASSRIKLTSSSGPSAARLAAVSARSSIKFKPNATGGRDIYVHASTSMGLGPKLGNDIGFDYAHGASRFVLSSRCSGPSIVPFGASSRLVLAPRADGDVGSTAGVSIPGGSMTSGTMDVLISGLSTDGFPFSLAETGNGVLLLANGMDPMVRWDCLTSDACFAGVAAPPTPMTMAGSGNGLILGNRWAYCRFIDKFGNKSNLSLVCGPVLMGRSMWISVIQVASNGAPICTSSAHGLTTGGVISIFGVDELPVTGQFTIVVIDQNNFSLAGITCTVGARTSKPSYWVQGSAQVVYSNVPVPTDPKITKREILRNLDGNAQTFYVDIWTQDVTSTTFSSSRLDDSLSAQTSVPLAYEAEMPEASRFDLPPSHKCVLEYHLGRVFAAVDRPYDIGNAVVSFGSSIVQGIGTNWLPTFVNRAFYCDGAQQIHHVSRVVNGQFLVLDQPYQGASNKFAGYSIRPSDTESRLVYYSEPDLPEAWPSWNAFAIPDHGDEITGLMVFKSYLFIVEKRHISQFTFKAVPGRDGFIFLKSHRGCINNRCHVLVEDSVYMLDEAGVHRFDGENSTHLSSKINNVFNDPTYPFRIDWASQNSLFWHSVQDPVDENIRWFVDFIGEPELTNALCYDYRRDRWWIEQYPEAITSSCTATIGYRRVLAGTTARRVVVLGEGTLDGISSSAYGALRGTIESATSTTITAVASQPAMPDSLAGVTMTITSGVAKGQSGIIVSNINHSTVEFWKQWDVVPQAGDTFLIGAVNWSWRNGWLPYIDEETDYSRDLAAVFKPTSSGASFDLQLWFDYANEPQNWTVPRSIDGVSTIAGSPYISINTDRARGYAIQRMQSRREQYGLSNYFVSLGASGFQGPEATRIFEMIINGVYSQARQH